MGVHRMKKIDPRRCPEGFVLHKGQCYKGSFITDFGKRLKMVETGTGKVTYLPRYAVWGEKGRDRNEVIETSNNLKYLKNKWGKNLKVGVINIGGKK